MTPPQGCRTSVTRRSSVDLPQPDGPISAPNSPRATSRLTPSSAATGPSAAGKTMETSRHAMSAVATLELRRLRREHDLVRHDLVRRHLARDLIERDVSVRQRGPDLGVHV